MFHLAGQIFLGLIVGTLARLVMPGRDPAGVIATALVGLAGSAVGALMGHDLFGAQRHPVDWIVSALGAITALVIYWLVIGARRNGEQKFFRRQ